MFANSGVSAIPMVAGISAPGARLVGFYAEISANGNALYFTEGQLNRSGQRQTGLIIIVASPFGTLIKIGAIIRLAEARSISPDDNRLYYHTRENGQFAIYSVSRR